MCGVRKAVYDANITEKDNNNERKSYRNFEQTSNDVLITMYII